MRIRKWYVDCTAEDGTVLIGYAGTLGRGPFNIPIQSVALYPSSGDPPDARWRMVAAPPSLEPGGGVRWHAQELRIEGAWEPRAEPVSRILLATPELRVDWRCHLPRGWARIALRDRTLEGWGYVEEMIIEGDLRRFPIRELHWGRFLGEADYTVWLDWKGPHPQSVLVVNGAEARGMVSREAVTLDDGRTIPLAAGDPPTSPSSSLDPNPAPGAAESASRVDPDPAVRVLADRRVGDAFFPPLPPLRWVVPRVLLGLRERKLSGRGRLRRDRGGEASEGWLLYETVEFP